MSVRACLSLGAVVAACLVGCDVDPGPLETRALAALVSPPGFTLEPNQTNAGLRFVAPAGDVDGDGFADALFVAPLFDGGGTDSGRAWLHLGGPAGLDVAPAWTMDSPQASAQLSVATGVGDVNGDGFGDVVVGEPGWTASAAGQGRARLFLGSSSGLATTFAWEAVGPEGGAAFGAAVAGACDVDRDGFSDLIVGAPTANGTAGDEGAVSLFFGSASGPSVSPDWVVLGAAAGRLFGASVACGGDVDGDGYPELAVGAPGDATGVVGGGALLVFAGSAAGLPSTPTWTRLSGLAGGAVGTAVAGLGDLDGDGFADLGVGAPNHGGGTFGQGRFDVFLGERAVRGPPPTPPSRAGRSGRPWGPRWPPPGT